MCTERRRARKGRPRHPIPEALPDDLFDYADEPTPDGRERRRSPFRIVDVVSLPVFDDWPEKVPITALRDRAWADATRIEAMLASSTHQRLPGAAVREHVRAFAQHVEVADDAIYIKGNKKRPVEDACGH